MGLDIAFENALLPIAISGGKCLFYLASISGIYCLIRGNGSEAIKKLKSSIVGYVMLTMIKEFVDLIDKLAATIHF